MTDRSSKQVSTLTGKGWALCTACSRCMAAVRTAVQVGRDSAVAAKIFEKGLDEPRLLREPDYVLQV